MKVSQRLLHSAVVLAIAGTASSLGHAATITGTGWNLDNVDVSTSSPLTLGESVIYDRAKTDPLKTTSGKVIFDGDESFSPGLTVQTKTFSAGGSSFGGCIGANSLVTGGQVGSAGCDGPFQSGKRFKNVLTGNGPIDFVFDTDPSDGDTDPYRLFHRLINDTGEDLVDLIVTLGTGVGSGFKPSEAGDGLSFSASTEFGGANLPATSQFPFGLFGDASTNGNFTLDGFFSAARSGLSITGFPASGETDQFTASGIFGPYSDLFGDWMTLSEVPEGAFWDDDGDATTDDLLIAWKNGSVWEQRRDFSSVSGELLADIIPIDPVTFSSFLDLQTSFGQTLGMGIIEDLANLNLNYAIDLADYGLDSFTLRVQGVSAVPTPATLALFGLGLAGLGYSRRKKA